LTPSGNIQSHEQARKEKVIGHSLDARVTIARPEKMQALFAAHLEDLRALLIVSPIASGR